MLDGMLELSFRQLDLRYEEVRGRDVERERRLLGSLANEGQKTPIIVVAEGVSRFVVVDGYKRVRCSRRLGWDVIGAWVWDLVESEALLMERLMREGPKQSALEQGWFLDELVSRFGISAPELARRFDRSESWVSRRLGLVRDLPVEVQRSVRLGQVGAYAATKYLLPLARAKRGDCIRLVAALGRNRLSSRQVGRLYAGYVSGRAEARDLLLADPLMYLRAEDEVAEVERAKPRTPAEEWLKDLRVIGAVVRRTEHRARCQIGSALGSRQHRQARRLWSCVRADFEALCLTLEKEFSDAGRVDAGDGAQAQGGGAWSAGDRQDPAHLPRERASGRGVGDSGCPGAGASGEGRAVPGSDPGAPARVQEQPCPSP
jgi:ParB/RepB/Spo0J family partition protein